MTFLIILTSALNTGNATLYYVWGPLESINSQSCRNNLATCPSRATLLKKKKLNKHL